MATAKSCARSPRVQIRFCTRGFKPDRAEDNSRAFQRWVGREEREFSTGRDGRNPPQRSHSVVPGGTFRPFGGLLPALKRWAILLRPAGLKISCTKPDLQCIGFGAMARRERIRRSKVRALPPPNRSSRRQSALTFPWIQMERTHVRCYEVRGEPRPPMPDAH